MFKTRWNQNQFPILPCRWGRGELGEHMLTLPAHLQPDVWELCVHQVCCVLSLPLYAPQISAESRVVAALWSLRWVQIMVSTPGGGQKALVGKRSGYQVEWLSKFSLHPCRDSASAFAGHRWCPSGWPCREQCNHRLSNTDSVQHWLWTELAWLLLLFIYFYFYFHFYSTNFPFLLCN